MGLTANNLPLQAYLTYIDLLAEWNTAYNLTAVRDPEKMLAYHVLDSLSILPFIQKGLVWILARALAYQALFWHWQGQTRTGS